MVPGLTEEAVLQLPDGRKLTYAIYGSTKAPSGTIIYHHGWPSCRLEAAVSHGAAERAGFRLVSFDRPGTAGSTFNPGYSFRSVVADVTCLMDHLGLRTAVHMGTSGGCMLTLHGIAYSTMLHAWLLHGTYMASVAQHAVVQLHPAGIVITCMMGCCCIVPKG